MRFLIASAALAAAVLAGTAAQAEKRLFIVSNSNGYGVDRCLASGAVCGVGAADSYCRSHEFAQALSYRKVERDDITGAIPSTGACHNPGCDEFVAIECSR